MLDAFWAIIQHLRLIEEGIPGVPPIPGYSVADIGRLAWDPDYVITNVPQAERLFHQVQAVVKFGYPRYGGTFSAVWSRLRGNLDNVSGEVVAILFQPEASGDYTL